MTASPTKAGLLPHFDFRKSATSPLVAALVFWCSLMFASPAPAADYSVPQVQAAFLYKFAQFTTWPSSAFSHGSSPLTIGVLGANPFGRALEDAVRGESAQGRRMIVKYSRRADDLKDCQIVFISRSESNQVDSTIAAFRGMSILTVSDNANFCNRGGMIMFYTEGGRVRFEINSSAARNAGLSISSKLLKIAKPSGN
jgi:hypothetical protein